MYIRSVVIEHLVAISVERDTVVVPIYLSYYERGTQTLANLFGSILSRVLCNVPCVPEELQERYRRCRTNGRTMGFLEYVESIRLIIQSLSKVFIAIDALDGCREGIRQPFLEAILSLQPKVQIFLTSRFGTSIPAHLKDLEPLEVCAKEGDMESYLSLRLFEEEQLYRTIQADACLEQSFVATIIKRSRGM